ncbi:DUF4465 domain-containing protein [Pedobacter frigoris]|uniref:DUF4465 domain-containing protein n=1 Tax=Pedobacter frigoris TaxID=2571272 RepID=UPI002930696E|nr:DUF4465 domain-containing protein [Pedobacter frigoris]
MKHKLIIMLAVICSIALFSCEKENRILIPYPEDITFEDQTLGTFTFNIPNAPFKSGTEKTGIVTMNVKNNGDGTFSGFAVSNKNWRSFPWSLSPDFPPAGGLTPAKIKSAIDSCIFSVYTTTTNQTNNFLVASVKDEDASFTIDKPTVVEHVLVANTSYNYLLETYGSIYSGTLDANTQAYTIGGTKVKNINIANPSTLMYGRFTLPGPGGQNVISLAGDEVLARRSSGNATLAKGFVKLTVKGYNGTAATGSVDYWLAIRPNVDPANPTFNYVAVNWSKVDLTALGVVNKVVFSLSSSYKDGAGNMLIAPYFCLDGIRLRK